MARYLKEVKTLFQHIPRTGGSWVEKALVAADIPHSRWLHRQADPTSTIRKHALLAHYRSIDIEIIKKSFCFVRHPLSYYESTWRWLARAGEQGRRTVCSRWQWHPLKYVAPHFNKDFNTFVHNVLENEPLFVTRLYEQYLGPDKTFMTYVGRTESLCNDFCRIMSDLGYTAKIAKNRKAIEEVGRVNCVDFEVEWDEDLRAAVLHSERLIIRQLPRYGLSGTWDVSVGTRDAVFGMTQ